MADFSGSVALVTGAGQGIGRAIAQAFAAAGASVVVNDLVGDNATHVAAELVAESCDAVAFQADIRRAAEVCSMVERAVEAFSHVDILVNNAGAGSYAPILEMEESEWDREMETNLKGTFLVSQAVARSMVRRGEGGRIVNIASTAASSARVGAASHCASKAGVVMLTRVMALELAQYRINVNAVSPGLAPEHKPTTAPSALAYRQAFLSMTPLARFTRPEDVAQAVLFLASPEASFITGHVLPVDGGFLAGRPLPASH